MNNTKASNQSPMDYPILVDSKRAAKMLSICPRKLWQMTKDGRIPSLKIDKSVRYRPADLERWTQEKTRPAASTEIEHGQHQ